MRVAWISKTGLEMEKHLIRKYANRKLYDTTTSRYITLDGISQLVDAGVEIQVVDRQTGQDITSVVLSQLVASEGRKARTGIEAGGVHDRRSALLGYLRRTLSIPASIQGVVETEVEKRRGEIEGAVEMAVANTVRSLNLLTRSDLELLQKRIDQLEARLSRLNGVEPKPKPRSRQ